MTLKPGSNRLIDKNKVVFLLIAVMCGIVILTGCASTLAPTAILSTTMPTPTSESTRTPKVSPTVTPSPTSTSTPSPVPTATSSPTLTPTPLHPLTIQSIREQSYPGSPIVIEEILAPGVNYERYYVSYLSEDLKIYALLTVPQGERPDSGWPVVVFNHGYIPPDVYRTTERYIAYVDGFARNGYIVLRSDYRGHDQSEGEASGAYSSPAYTVDIMNAVTSIAAYPDADPQRIGMWGHSMGGSITLQIMVSTKVIKAGVIWAGMVGSYSDINQWWMQRLGIDTAPTPDPEGTRRRGFWDLIDTYGTVAENPEFWSSISATSYLADVSGPIQLHHGTADASVPYVWSENLYAALQQANQVTEFYGYAADNHNISNNFSSAMNRSIAFFDVYVKGED